MPSFVFWLLVFAFGTQVVLSGNGNNNGNIKLNVPDGVRQCAPVSIVLEDKGRGDDEAAPSGEKLKVLPVNGTAFTVPLPNLVTTGQGLNVSFLPLGENVTFLLTLDNITGDAISRTSDVIRVESGSDSSCIQSQSATRAFTVVGADNTDTQPRQCEPFTVRYDTNLVTVPPVVRAFRPGRGGRTVETVANSTQGEATYRLSNMGHGEQYLLLLQGPDGQIMETTPLWTVGGDSASPDDCIQKNNFNSNGNGNDKKKGGGLDQKTIIGLAIGGSIVAVIALVMVAYLVWERRSRRVSIHFDPSLMEKRSLPPSAPQSETSSIRPQTVTYQPYEGFVHNPPYTANTMDTENSRKEYWPVPPPLAANQADQNRDRRPTMESLTDIEGILNNQEQRVRDGFGESPFPSPVPSLAPAEPAFAVRALSARGQIQQTSVARTQSTSSSNHSPLDPFVQNSRLPPPPPPAVNRSHFSVMTSSSFGGGPFDNGPHAPVPDSMPTPTSADLTPRRLLPVTAFGLGRGKGEAL